MDLVQVTVILAGRAAGATSLDVTERQRFRAVSVPVLVSDAVLASGAYGIESPLIGVAVYAPVVRQYESDSMSAPLGVAVYAPVARHYESDLMSQPLGVAVYAPTARALSVDRPSAAVGASVGPVADAVLPASIGRNASLTLILTGSGLDEVSALQFIPADGITVSGALVSNVDGTSLQVPVTVAADAAIGARAIALIGPQGAGTPDIELDIAP